MPTWKALALVQGRRTVVASGALLIVSLGLLLLFVASRGQAAALEDWRGRLVAMAADRASVVDAWAAGVMADARVLGSAMAMEHSLTLPPGPQRDGERHRAAGSLEDAVAVHGYTGALLLDDAGAVIAASEGAIPSESALALGRDVIGSRAAGIRFSDGPGEAVVVVAAPVSDGLQGPPAGSLVLLISPAPVLHAILTNEPVPTRTGETLLVGRSGDDVVFLSPRRKGAPGAWPTRSPAAAAPSPALAALDSGATFDEWEVDYAQSPVLAATARLTHAPWGIVAKVDREEALAGHWRETALLGVALAMLLTALFAIATWRFQEQRLKQERRFRRLFEKSSEGIFFATQEGRILDANPACRALLGLGDGDLGRLAAADFFATPAERKAFTRAIDERGEVRNLDVRLRSRSGLEIHALLSATVTRPADGDAVVFQGLIRDITERKRAEEALRRSQKRLSEAQAIAHIGNWDWDLGTDALHWSDEVYRIFGLEPAALEPSHEAFLLRVHPADRDRMQQAFEAALRGDAEYEVRHRILTSDGAERVVHERGAVVRDAEGRPVRMVGTVQDVTEWDRAEAQVRMLNRELEDRVSDRTAELTAANAELEAFAYSVSHDLRAPLRSMDGFSEALLDDYAASLDATGRDYLARIRAASRRMGSLIDDILALSRTTRGEMHREVVDLTAMARDVAVELRQGDPDRSVEFTAEEGMSASGDPRMLRIVLDNLIGNAWKFTGGTSEARVEVRRDQTERGDAFTVRDNGAGFEMAYADKLFSAFQRLHGAGEFPGNGIGLATVQRVIHRHGGEVWATGAPGAGAVLYFTIPQRPSSEPAHVES